MVSVKVTAFWRLVLTAFWGVLAGCFWPQGGAIVALLGWEEASLELPHLVHGCDVFPGACTDHSAVHQRGIMTIYIQQFPYIKFSGIWPCCRRV